ncbi:MAG: acetyl-CoA carboxylase biotin carboxylase subunit [candidate division Zixibacteria bacterium SM23_73_3]|nr:MAG: acetyl-CoA carboxylase biotin carboxylase subunit [candidate division Zixibacteria bacterium SM23_73_3]
MFQKVLIANRGEIALRIIRACKELGIATVAIFSEGDTQSLHVRFADEDVCIGPAKSQESYLDPKRIISAAEVTNADAIHPGYGFLAENPDFAEICESCDIKFIGPSSETIRLMGDKALAKDSMRKAGVPVIPGSDGVVKSEEMALNLCHQIGFPVIIKASFGGGGKGIRIATNEAELKKGFQMAKLEAEAAFGNPEVYIEKYLPNPRHIEIQILGDNFGDVIHLGERDCSLQRRHQKLLEESPSPVVSEGLREKMGDAAVTGARSVSYQSAGTVEFLLDQNKNFYFMEMNTRIQVEHPVTEEVTDVDLIKEQIRLACGEKLALSQDDICLKGHAIECRINAEDPHKGFLPSPGTIESFHVPGGHGIRVDTHAYAKYVIPPYYDSMIAKLIAHGKNREEAILKARRALDEFIIEGIPTTIDFHKKILADKRFISGEFTTSLIEEILKEQLQEVEKA